MEINVVAEDGHKLGVAVNRVTDDPVTKNAGKFLTN